MGTQRVAVIGLGPSGAIAIDALAREQAFAIRVFERREAPGGCWYGLLSFGSCVITHVSWSIYTESQTLITSCANCCQARR